MSRICRTCYDDDESASPLLAPCLCNGSLKHVHQSCLETWMRLSRQDDPRVCPTCRYRYQVREVVATPYWQTLSENVFEMLFVLTLGLWVLHRFVLKFRIPFVYTIWAALILMYLLNPTGELDDESDVIDVALEVFQVVQDKVDQQVRTVRTFENYHHDDDDKNPSCASV